jgi:hypothetical protein
LGVRPAQSHQRKRINVASIVPLNIIPTYIALYANGDTSGGVAICSFEWHLGGTKSHYVVCSVRHAFSWARVLALFQGLDVVEGAMLDKIIVSVQVVAEWVPTALVWVATSDDVPGLVAEHSDFAKLQEMVTEIIPVLLIENKLLPPPIANQAVFMIQCLEAIGSRSVQLSDS